MKLRLVIATAAACLAAVVLQAQQPPAQPGADSPPVTFRAEINYVEVDAVVTDAQGNLVSDLQADDFELLEDRKPQKISAFSLVNLPIERADRPLFATAPIEPDVQVNTGSEGRLYLIVLDTLHTAAVNVPRVRAAARQFIERSFGTNDIAAVVFTGGQTGDTQDFTNNPRLLLAAIDRFSGRKTQGATLARTEQFNTNLGRQAGDSINDPLEFERAYAARSAMERIRELSNFMAGVRGRRKAMLLIGEGIEYNIYDIINNTQASGVLESVRDAVAAATRANVVIYPIDPRGLTNPDADLISSPSSPGASDPSLGDLGSRSIAREFQQSQDSLRALAADTGGFSVLNRNDFTGAFERIVRDNSNYYVLGYYPTNERRDGRFRTITVRAKRPGLQIRARRGYVAPRGRVRENTAARPSDPVAVAVLDAMSSPLPIPSIPLRLFVAPYKGEAPNAAIAVAVEFDVKGFGFTEANGTFNNKVEVALVASDTQGKQRAEGRHVVDMAMKPDTMDRTRERGMRLITQIDLPPGRYQLRVAVAESGNGKSGSVIADLEVPDFSKQPLTMSGLTLTSASAAGTTTIKHKDPLADFLPGPATVQREFDRADELALFAEFYENQPKAPPHAIDITTTLRAEGGRVVTQNAEVRQSTELQGGRGGFGFTARLPLADLAPGLYVLRVEARSRASQAESAVGRDVQIRIR